MRRLLTFTAALLAGAGISAAHAGDINFGVAITGEIVPGVYGHVVLGNAPPPPVIYARPVVIVPPPPGVVVEPLYLNVPPDHARHWRLHCHEYHACNRPVYFVRSAEYAPGFDLERWRHEHPHWRDDQRWRHHDARGWGRGHARGHDRDRAYDHDRRDDDHGHPDHDRRWDHDRGHDHDHGEDRGRNHDHGDRD